MAWNAALALQYGYGRVFREYPQEVLEQQPTRAQLPVFQPTPVALPKIGQYQPHSMDSPEELAVLIQQPPRRLLAIFQPPVALIDRLRQQQMKWWPHAMDLPEAFAVLIQQPPRRLLPIFQPPPIPYPRAWRVYLDNWAAVGRKDEVLYIARNSISPEPPLGPSPAWAWQLDNQAAVSRLDQILYLIQSASLVLTLAPPTPIPGTLISPWAKEVANWASIGYKQQVTYLIQSAARALQNSLPPFHPSVIEGLNYAAIGRLDSVLYQVRNRYGRFPDIPPFKMPWRDELANWAALIGGIPIAISLVKQYSPLPGAIQFIPAWKFELDNLASIQYKQRIIYLIKTGLVVLSPFVPPPVQALFISTYLNWRLYYTEWPQIATSYKLPVIELITPTPQPPPPIGEISCYTIEAPPTATAFLLAESPYVNVFMTETGLIVALTGESPHICIG